MAKIRSGYAVIVYSGQEGSLEEKFLKAVVKGLTKRGKDYKVIDLYGDKFSANFEGANLRLYSRGETTDKNVMKYQEMIKGANELYFVYPTKWQGMDAMMKGFCDKVFLKNGFWYTRKTGWFGALWGEMLWIKRSRAITHHTETRFDRRVKMRNSSRVQATRGIMFALKMKRIRMSILPGANRTLSDKALRDFVIKIEKKISKG